MKKSLMVLLVLAMVLVMGASAFAEEPPTNWGRMMRDAAVLGDHEAGEAAAEGWNLALLEGEREGEPMDFEELFLLARVIETEAGSDWLPDELLMCVGEVVLNRMASPEFPDTMEEVVYQEGQYEDVCTKEFEELLPGRRAVQIAMRLLQGERMLQPNVVFQSNRKLGTVHATYCDKRLGFTYFCESSHPELYEDADSDLQSEEIVIEYPGE